MATENSLPDMFWLQPHLLPRETLINILHSKCLKLQELNIMSKDELVNIFMRIAIPLPQRQYQQNRRGKLLTQYRNKREKAKRLRDDSYDSSVSFGFKNGPSSSISPCSPTLSGIADRLKPPPDAINYERKKIKLSVNTSISNKLDKIHINRKTEESNGNVLDRIIINDRTKIKCEKEVENEVEKCKRKTLNTSECETKECETTALCKEDEVTPRRIKLKRSHSSALSSTKPPQQKTTEIEISEQKKQRSKITWP